FDAFKVPDQVPDVAPEDETPQPLVDLLDAHRELTRKNILECYHDTQQGYDQALSLFNLGHLTLRQRSYAERVYWTTLAKIERLTRTMEHVPEELDALPNLLSDTYFCNFSVFQSLPDSWAIDQLFPVMPIHRLDEAPTRRGTLADISCDSDGKIDKFPGLREDKNVLELHPFNGQPYHIGAFLIGAYQEILGDMHNLLGDTHVVHVSLETDGEVSIDQVVSGDSVSDVLQYVDYNAKELAEKMRRDVEKAVKQNKLTLAESTKLMRFYEAGLNGYTYLEDPGNA
ncbi:MAG: arginine decarboxylase, partial [Phycisphaeraceae bacterium]